MERVQGGSRFQVLPTPAPLPRFRTVLFCFAVESRSIDDDESKSQTMLLDSTQEASCANDPLIHAIFGVVDFRFQGISLETCQKWISRSLLRGCSWILGNLTERARDGVPPLRGSREQILDRGRNETRGSVPINPTPCTPYSNLEPI
jgi:hypothetical protein